MGAVSGASIESSLDSRADSGLCTAAMAGSSSSAAGLGALGRTCTPHQHVRIQLSAI